MDDRRFDRLTRSLAGGVSRRRMVQAGIAGWLAFRGRSAAAQGRPDDTIDIDDTGSDDVPPCSDCVLGQRCVAGACCNEAQVCGQTCCPPESIGCAAPPSGPDGPLGEPSCLCPGSLGYDARTNTCVCHGIGEACATDADCCVHEWYFQEWGFTGHYGRCADGICQCCPVLPTDGGGHHGNGCLADSDICCGPGQHTFACCTGFDLREDKCTGCYVGCCAEGDCDRAFDAACPDLSPYQPGASWRRPHPEACVGEAPRR